MSVFRAIAVALTAQACIGALAQSMPTEPLTPYRITVIDAQTESPIPAFDYFYYVAAASGYTAGDRQWTAVESETGSITLHLPASCQLTFAARARGYVYDTLDVKYYDIQTNAPRQRDHALKRGITVTGRVIDAATSQPVAGVRISPEVFCNPGSRPDHDRSTFSDATGAFRIDGIAREGGSVEFEHADYLPAGWRSYDLSADAPRPATGITIELRAGETIFGVVSDPAGTPIAGANVDAYHGKKAVTAADGSFRIRGVYKGWGYGDLYVNVKHPDYMEYWKTPHDMPPEGFKVTLQPLFKITGRVVAPDGKPVTRFAVMAGPGKTPDKYFCRCADATDTDGRFTIAIDTRATWLGGTAASGEHLEPRHWLAVRADGYEVWEDLVPFAETGATVTVSLKSGFDVSGRLTGIPGGFAAAEATLIPQREPSADIVLSGNASQQFATINTSVNPDGTWRFTHVRPDKYALRIAGHGITPYTTSFEVTSADLAIDPIEVQRTGRVTGQILTSQRQPWAFARGVLSHPALGDDNSRHFRAAQDGTFTLDDVPAGEAQVGVECGGGCFFWVDSVKVRVVPGETVTATVTARGDASQRLE